MDGISRQAAAYGHESDHITTGLAYHSLHPSETQLRVFECGISAQTDYDYLNDLAEEPLMNHSL